MTRDDCLFQLVVRQQQDWLQKEGTGTGDDTDVENKYFRDSAKDLPEYRQRTEVFMLDRDFVEEGRVSLTNVTGTEQFWHETGAGCRQFTFSNGKTSVTTEMYGFDHCNVDYDGTAVGSIDITGAVDFNVGNIRYHDVLYDYESPDFHPTCADCTPMLQYGFRL